MNIVLWVLQVLLAAAFLAHEDRAAGDEIAVVTLHAQSLRVAVAPVT